MVQRDMALQGLIIVLSILCVFSYGQDTGDPIISNQGPVQQEKDDQAWAMEIEGSDKGADWAKSKVNFDQSCI